MKNQSSHSTNRKAGHFDLRYFGFLLAALAIGLLFSSCEKESAVPGDDLSVDARAWQSPDMVMAWNQAIQDLYTFPLGVGAPPPVLSRIVAMEHLAMHDALNCITPRYARYVGVPRDKDADPDAAVAQAAYDMIKALSPGQNLPAIEALLQQSLGGIPDGDAKTRGIALGHAVTAAILAHRSADGPYLNPNYNPKPAEGTAPGEFRYLPPLQYGLAGFHLLEPFFMESQDQFLCEAPYVINSPAYTADFNEVKEKGALTGSTRTPDESEIGVFWAENSSRGWNGVARQVLASRPAHSVDAWKAARLLALMHATIGDSYISNLDSKMYHYFWRPISAIRLGDSDGNPNTTGDPAWTPVLLTPPLGDHPSAHAQAGAAAAQVLIRFFNKDNYDLDLDSGYMPGVIRSYNKISDAVHENSLSRIYIGYHFRNAVEVGEEVGFALGDYIYENALQGQ